MQYWINFNGVQSGPVDLEGLKQMRLTSAAFVWREGMSDWARITQLPELQGCYEMEGAPAPAQPQQPQPQQPQPEYSQPAQPQPPAQQQPVQPQPGPTAEPCPPTNLVWAIIATLLCCIPTGIVAIVYALKVGNKYREGDIEGAKRASDTGAWWCIASFVLGIIGQLLYGMVMLGIGSQP